MISRLLLNKLYYIESKNLPIYGIRYQGKNTIRPKLFDKSFLIKEYIKKYNINKNDIDLVSTKDYGYADLEVDLIIYESNTISWIMFTILVGILSI